MGAEQGPWAARGVTRVPGWAVRLCEASGEHTFHFSGVDAQEGNCRVTWSLHVEFHKKLPNGWCHFTSHTDVRIRFLRSSPAPGVAAGFVLAVLIGLSDASSSFICVFRRLMAGSTFSLLLICRRASSSVKRPLMSLPVAHWVAPFGDSHRERLRPESPLYG